MNKDELFEIIMSNEISLTENAGGLELEIIDNYSGITKMEDNVKDAILLENNSLVSVDNMESVNVKYFMDGVQKTILIGNVVNVALKVFLPIYYYSVAAIILEEKNGLDIYNVVTDDGIITPPKKYIPRSLLDKLGDVTEITDLDFKRYNNALNTIVINYTSRKRARLEKEIVHAFNKDDSVDKDAWFVIDGAIVEKKMLSGHSDFDSMKKVGLVKRHVKKYIHDGDMFDIKLLLSRSENPFVRSPKFRIIRSIGKVKTELVSAYSALHTTNMSINDRLIRIEIPERHEKEFDDVIYSILRMQAPISNCRAIGKKIFPIYTCEEALKIILYDSTLINHVIQLSAGVVNGQK